MSGQPSRRRGALSAPIVEEDERDEEGQEYERRNSADDISVSNRPADISHQRRRSSFSSVVQQLRRKSSDVDLALDVDEVGDEEDEDSGHVIKQLLIRISSIVVNARRLRRRKSRGNDETQPTPAERLVVCIRKVWAATYSRSIQGKLQDMILAWLEERPAIKKNGEAAVDFNAKVHARGKFWSSFQANTQKWEGIGRCRAAVPDDDDEEDDPHAAILQRLSLKSFADRRQKGLPGPRARAADAMSHCSFNTLSNFNRSANADSIEHIAEEVNGSAESRTSLLEPALGNDQKNQTWPSRKQPIRNMKTPSRRTIRQRPSSAPCGNTQSRPRSHGGWPCGEPPQERYVFGANQSKVVPKVHRARLCLSKPKVKPLQLEEATTIGACKAEADLKPKLANSKLQMSVERASGDKPPPFSCPQDGVNSAAIVQSGEWKYFKECQRLKMLPRVPPFLVKAAEDRDSPEDATAEEGVYRFSLAGRSLLDRDLRAFGPPLQMLEAEVMTIDMSDNGFSDQGLAGFLTGFEAPDVRELRLARTGAKGMTVDTVLRRMSYDWKSLRALHLSGCHLPGNTWGSFCDALIEFKFLAKLDLSDTSLGRVSQQHVAHVSRFVASSGFLHQLDLSGNYVLHDGFEAFTEAIHRTRSLKSLDLSYNACNAVGQSRRQRLHKHQLNTSEDLMKGPGGELYQDLPNFNPVALLCEALRDNSSLKELRLVSTFLDYSADCSLLLALLANDTLEMLDVSDNPHGEEGLGTILRLIVHPDGNLVYCDIKDFRDGTNGPGTVRLDFGGLSSHYELELRHPQHRAVLAWLLRAAEHSGLQNPQAAFTVSFWSGTFEAGGKHAPWSWPTDRGWAVADSGCLSFNFSLKIELQNEPNVAAALSKWHKTQRIPVTMSRFVPLLAMFKRLTTSEQKIQFAKAMGDTLLFKMCHLKKLMQAAPCLSHILAKLLYPRLIDSDQFLLFDLLDNYPHLQRVFRREARSSFFFNDNNPTSHYEFHLEQPIDRTMAERLHVINHFDMLLAQRSGRIDTSQFGNYEGVRNASFLDKRFASFLTFAIPDHGCLSLDYVSPLHASASKNDRAATNIFLGDLIEALDSSTCCSEDKVSALRTISHHLVLTPEQVVSVCNIFPNPFVKDDAKKRVSQAFRSLIRRNSMKNLALGLKIKKSSAFQIRLDNCRVECFVVLFCRCTNSAGICTHEYLWHPQSFTPGCSKSARERLGRIRTLDALYCGRPYSQFLNMDSADADPTSTRFQRRDTQVSLGPTAGLQRQSSPPATQLAQPRAGLQRQISFGPTATSPVPLQRSTSLPEGEDSSALGIVQTSSEQLSTYKRESIAARKSFIDERKARASVFGMGRSLAAAKAIAAIHEMEVGRRYSFQLDIYEDWAIARFILQLSEEEDCTNITKCSWSERKTLEEQGLDFVVPSGWYVNLPQEGLFSCTLVSEKEDPDLRFGLAVKMLGWEKG